MWRYEQSTGAVLDEKGREVGRGYAGRGEGRNNPAMQHVKNQGPLPRGVYVMQPPVNTRKHGPYVIWLKPDGGNEMFGRGDFGIHGDSKTHPGQASNGCICVAKKTRLLMWESYDHLLLVVGEREEA